MVVRIVNLSDGHLSLEFEEEDFAFVKMIITKLFNDVSTKRYFVWFVGEVSFGGATFTY